MSSATAAQLQNCPERPSVVAETICEAITTDRPRLRYPSGRPAPAVIAGRAAMTDEEWVAMGREMTAEEWIEANRALGFDV